MTRRLFWASALLLVSGSAAQAQDTAYCTLPGELVSEDAIGDGTDPSGTQPSPVPAHDIKAVHFAEPGTDAAGRLHIVLKVGEFPPVDPPNGIYQVNFVLADGVERFVSWAPYKRPDLPKFTYGHVEILATGTRSTVSDGPTDPESVATPDGTILWVVPAGKIPGLETGAVMDNIVGEARFLFGVTTGVTLPTDTTPAGFYEVRGNASCAGAGKSGSGLVAGGLPAGLLLLLAMAGWAQRAWRD